MDRTTKIGIGGTAAATALVFIMWIWPQVSRDIAVPGLIVSLAGAVWGFWPSAEKVVSQATSFLAYLRHRDSVLGSAIDSMARHSAWGRWFAAQWLANSGRPIDEGQLLRTAGSLVIDKILDGSLVIRGRLPGQLDYHDIPREHWRSSVLHFVKDPVTLWRLEIIPRGGVRFDPDGTWHADAPEEEQRNAAIRRYDSLLVDARQFESVWPKYEAVADKKRQQFLRDARKRRLDKDTIRALS